jgi:anaerobic magnesium-protoporphyrin IX monomethyl ester cyclase
VNILLINMPTPSKESFGRASQPLGLAYLASYLRVNGEHRITIVEANGEGLSLDDVRHLATREPFDLVGFSSTTPSFAGVEDIARAVKALAPSTFTIAGGHHVSAVGHDCLNDAPSLDGIVVGEGEITLFELVNALERDTGLGGIAGLAWRSLSGEVVWNGTRHLHPHLDDLPWPARDLLPPLENYAGVRRWPTLDLILTATISASRGCPYRCSFCDIQSFYRRESGPMRRLRKPANVVAEMTHLAREAGVGHFSFVDDLFPYAPGWVRAFAAELTAAKLVVTYSFAARADQVLKHPELLGELRMSGCSSIEMGIESGSQAVLDRYRKDLTAEINEKAVKTIRESGIRVIMDYIMFDPWTTLGELRESLAYLEAVGAEANYPTPVYTSLSFYPGTPLYEEAIQHFGKLPTGELNWFEDATIAKIYNSMMNFRREVQSSINVEINAWREIHRDAIGRQEQVRETAVDQMFLLRSLPHQTLRNLVDASEAVLADEYERVRGRVKRTLAASSNLRFAVSQASTTALKSYSNAQSPGARGTGNDFQWSSPTTNWSG